MTPEVAAIFAKHPLPWHVISADHFPDRVYDRIGIPVPRNMIIALANAHLPAPVQKRYYVSQFVNAWTVNDRDVSGHVVLLVDDVIANAEQHARDFAARLNTERKPAEPEGQWEIEKTPVVATLFAPTSRPRVKGTRLRVANTRTQDYLISRTYNEAVAKLEELVRRANAMPTARELADYAINCTSMEKLRALARKMRTELGETK